MANNSDRLIEAQINFFGPFLKIEEIPKVLDPKNKHPANEMTRTVLEAFFNLPASCLSQELLERYVEVTTREAHTHVIPHTERLLNRLAKPLASAKKNFCFGEYSAAIALSGSVAEMLVLLLWDINDIRVKGELMTQVEEKGLFGSVFNSSRLSHYRRLQILKTFGLVAQEEYDLFENLRLKRNEHLHSWSVDLSNEKEDALTCVKTVFKLFITITGVGISEGKIQINPKLFKLFEGLSRESS